MLMMLKKQMRVILIATIFLIIPSFILFYGARQTGRTPGHARHAGEVYGRNVSHEEYRQSLQWAYISARMRYGDQLENIEQFLNLEQEAWQNLVLFEAARRRGITVTDRELLSFITSLPVFLSEDGEFDSRLYHNILSYALGLRPEQFERFMRRELAISRLQEQAADGIRVTETEVKNFYAYLNEEVMVEYVLFSAEEFIDEAEASEEMLAEYFRLNPERFRQPEMRQIEYMAFEPDPGEFKAERQEIEAYYRRNIEKFLVMPEDGEDEPEEKPLEEVYDEIKERLTRRKASAQARRQAEEVILSIEEGFIFWEDLEREKTGFITLDSAAISPWLAGRAFDSEPGRVSGPFEIGGRFYILKVTDRNPAYIPSTHEIVRDEVKKIVLKEEARRLSAARAREFLEMAEEKSSLESAAEGAGRDILTTEYFSRNARIPNLGAAGEFAAKAFTLSEAEPFASATLPDGAAVMALTGSKPVDMGKFEEEKERFRHYVESEKREKIFADWFNLILSEADARFFLDEDDIRAPF